MAKKVNALTPAKPKKYKRGTIKVMQGNVARCPNCLKLIRLLQLRGGLETGPNNAELHFPTHFSISDGGHTTKCSTSQKAISELQESED